MARRPRLQFPGAVYHVMSRGNRKARIYEDDDDRRVFLTIVAKTVERYGVGLYAWCLMPNHYHLVLDTPRGNLSDAMRYINGVFTQSTNRLHRRTGHALEGRFRSLVVQRESYLRRVARYVVLNPVRARLVSDVSAWPWSSYRATAGLDPEPSFLDLRWMAIAFPDRPDLNVREHYVQFVTSPVVPKIRLDAPRGVIGGDRFARAVRQAMRDRQPDRVMPFDHRAVGRPTLDELFAQWRTRATRNVTIRRAHVEYGYQLAEIASVLGIHASTASLALRQLERQMEERDRARGTESATGELTGDVTGDASS